ncbi:MAG TPA: hypothetical protein VLE89_00110 [Chlamydiales bacterium]|nr:hypothetical protein [Chlamydiales bacterium]
MDTEVVGKDIEGNLIYAPMSSSPADTKIGIGQANQDTQKIEEISPGIIEGTERAPKWDNSSPYAVKSSGLGKRNEISADFVSPEANKVDAVAQPVVGSKRNDDFSLFAPGSEGEGPARLAPEDQKVSSDPFPALEILKAGQRRYESTQKKMDLTLENIRKAQEKIDRLLDFNTELITAPSDKDYHLSDKAKAIRIQLSALGITVWEKDIVKKEAMGGLKSLIGTRISQFEKEVQRLISTSALVELNLQQSIDQTMKKVVDTQKDEIQAILRNMGK